VRTPVNVPPGVYVAEHELVLSRLAATEHDVALNVPVPVVDTLHVTVPVGATTPSPVTVALHTVGALIGSGLGVQMMAVVVPRTAARLPVPLLPACVVASPPYVAVSVWGPATVGV